MFGAKIWKISSNELVSSRAMNYIYSEIPISRPPLGLSFQTTFGQSQRWSLIRGTLGVGNEEKNNLHLAYMVFNR